MLIIQNEVSYILISCVKVPKSDKDYDLRVPKDMAYIFSGAYITLSCKLIEQVRRPEADATGLITWSMSLFVSSCSHLQVLERDGWTGLEEITRLLNGHEFSIPGWTAHTC